jgi:uncharacterized membrane protein YdfJ with MMPL/SSD domain
VILTRAQQIGLTIGITVLAAWTLARTFLW